MVYIAEKDKGFINNFYEIKIGKRKYETTGKLMVDFVSNNTRGWVYELTNKKDLIDEMLIDPDLLSDFKGDDDILWIKDQWHESFLKPSDPKNKSLEDWVKDVYFEGDEGFTMEGSG